MNGIRRMRLALLGGALLLGAVFGCSGGNASFTVLSSTPPATLVRLDVATTQPRIALGTTARFTATGIYSDNTSQDLTASVVWSSSSTSVATVDVVGVAAAVASGQTMITAASGSISGSAKLTVTSATLSAIKVSPTNPSIASGTTRQFTATGIFNDNSTQDLTASAVWSSTSVSIATISATGLATAAAAGSSTITATHAGVSGSTTLTVTSATLSSIQVSPINPRIASGTSRQFTAMGIFSDKSIQDLTTSAAWSSSSTGVAAVSSTGMASAVSPGSSTITATFAGISGSTTLTVTSATLSSIQVSPINPRVALGMVQQFTAVGFFSDNSAQDLTASVVWSTSSSSVATISNITGFRGLAATAASGTATITAAAGTVSGSTAMTVTPATLVAIQLDPSDPSIALGTTTQFIATGIYSDSSTRDLTAAVTWSSSNDAIAAISSAAGSAGLANAVSAGSVTISATLGAVSGSTVLAVTTATLVTIEVDPIDPRAAAGTSLQFTAIGIYSDNTIQDLTASISWTSSSTNVATISNAPGSNGLAKGLAAGTATIMASAGGIAGSTIFTVTSAVLQSIDITPPIPSIATDMQQQFFATGTYSDSTTADLTASVVWTSSSTTVAVISNAPGSIGLATPLGAGLTTISATLSGVIGSTDLTVTPATLVSIDVTPLNPTISMAATEQFSAFGNYSDGSVQDLTGLVTWTSSDTAVATISNAAGSIGLATPIASGTSTITARFDGVSGVSTLTVTAATLSSIVISPTPTARIALGTSLPFTATGNFNDGSTQDLTASVLWVSSNTVVATASNIGGSNGVVTGIAAGTTNITAALGSVASPATTLTVTAATLSTITITQATGTIFIGASSQFAATGNFTDGTTQDLTTQVTWKSSDRTVATVGNTAKTKGLVTPLKAGTVIISATLVSAGVTGSTGIITVSAATLLGITVTPIDPTVALTSKTLHFTAIGSYTTGTQDLTKSTNLTWSSSNTAVATIANKPTPKKGLATLVSKGTTTIKAQLKGSLSGTSFMTVN